MDLKRVMAAVISAVMLCTAVPTVGVADTYEDTVLSAIEDGYEFEPRNNRLYRSWKTGDVVVPEAFGEYSVQAVNSDAFRSVNGLTSVILPDTVTNIGSYAFAYCYDLKAVYIPSSVTHIGHNSFDGSMNAVIYVDAGSYAEEHFKVYEPDKYVVGFDEAAFHNVTATAEPSLPDENFKRAVEVGDYAELGSYNGERMLWRCVGEDANGSLMIADKILCVKQFDAAGDHQTEYTEKSGLNLWSKSNIRCWLNSSETAGNVEYVCSNPPDYRDEAGFLTNFSDSEKSMIKTVTNRSIVGSEQFAQGGGAMPVFSTEFDSWGDIAVINNFDKLYYETSEDKVFLPDLRQVKSLRKSGLVYYDNLNYYEKYGAQDALEILTPSYSKQKFYSVDDYWTRTPVYYPDGGWNTAVYVGTMYKTVSKTGGVRPMFYLNEDTAEFSEGDGTREKPYKASDGKYGEKQRFKALPTRSKVMVNGVETAFCAYNIHDENYFRLRDIAIAVNGSENQFDITYDGDKNLAVMTKESPYTGEDKSAASDMTEKTAVYSSQMLIYKYPDYEYHFFMNIRAYNIDGSNYCRLRDIAGLTGFSVDWDADTDSISITAKAMEE